jgi:SAM-dependent methyltransferase
MQADQRKHLTQLAAAPYRTAGYVDWQWARNKLGRDPIFAALLDKGLLRDGAKVVDLGCGRGLLAAWYFAAERMAEQGRWQGAAPPKGLRFHGYDLIAKHVDAGCQALRPLYGERVEIEEGDMRHARLDGADAIAILDVLHYVPPEDQEALLRRVHAALPAGGLLVTRVGNADGNLAFRFSQLVDGIVNFQRDFKLPKLWCRPLADWLALLDRVGFDVQPTPMSKGTPFANVMLVAHRRGAAAAGASSAHATANA